ncbi:TfoX/Sxy family DNA transformation protein [Yoonia vestfoldensis]|uniref:Competence protein TfoX n=1 Tax=Yoonia vestfoldensis TaxID=245188 RepID=A0A1Y0EBB6_9RHOB|nr:TfoX/Sxy family DNA transformation protein [Yoonia vestfoldensis]ARU00927.1 competence protein TfoX [Yoonia vestfoldensis]
MTALETIRNIGPAFGASLRRAGIMDAQSLREIGADAAYARLLENGERAHFIPYYVLHMALQGRPWNDCKGAEKDALRAKFDALKARHCDSDHAEMEKILNRIGVLPAKIKS